MPETHIIVAIVWAVLLGGLGGFLTSIGPWYRALKAKPASWLIVPYFIWVSFAAILNLDVVRLNGPFSEANQAAKTAA